MGVSTDSWYQYRKWGSHHLYNQIDCATTREAPVGNEFSESELHVRQKYGIFFSYYSRNDHDLFYQLHEARVFSELIFYKVDI